MQGKQVMKKKNSQSYLRFIRWRPKLHYSNSNFNTVVIGERDYFDSRLTTVRTPVDLCKFIDQDPLEFKKHLR